MASIRAGLGYTRAGLQSRGGWCENSEFELVSWCICGWKQQSRSLTQDCVLMTQLSRGGVGVRGGK